MIITRRQLNERLLSIVGGQDNPSNLTVHFMRLFARIPRI